MTVGREQRKSAESGALQAAEWEQATNKRASLPLCTYRLIPVTTDATQSQQSRAWTGRPLLTTCLFDFRASYGSEHLAIYLPSRTIVVALPEDASARHHASGA